MGEEKRKKLEPVECRGTNRSALQANQSYQSHFSLCGITITRPEWKAGVDDLDTAILKRQYYRLLVDLCYPYATLEPGPCFGASFFGVCLLPED